ncbi:hypothetical protein psal_cds_1210 [Pandoravirus salinus]|uniref:Uncharacterized protein n=1 Tax=Pandoravirus salinus TaxID=1349410 RepID=S4W494_9VIRU|nr:hypothetical protein psal_cds_1210 [Pandoravirus salinus]AGO85512.1 hypothetical protein psal_cds_1210 [Pandoravirus salinus]
MATDTRAVPDPAQSTTLAIAECLPSLVMEAIFDAYLQVASPPGCAAAACRRRWLARHAPLVGAPEFCRAARRFARVWLPRLPSVRTVCAVPLVSSWQGCDLGAPWLDGAGTLTLVGSRDCGGKNAAACDIVAGMRGQVDWLYVARILDRLAGRTCCNVMPDCGASVHTATLSGETAAKAVDAIVAAHTHDPRRRHQSAAILIEACDRYMDGGNVQAADGRRDNVARFVDSIGAAKRCGIHVVATVSSALAFAGGLCLLRAAADRFVLVAPDAGRRLDVATLFAPLTGHPASTLLALMAVVDRYDAIVFERTVAPSSESVSAWVRRQKHR